MVEYIRVFRWNLYFNIFLSIWIHKQEYLHIHKTRAKIELIGVKKKTIKTEQRVESVKHNCTTVRLQDRHLHISTKYLLGRFYDSKKHRNTSSSSSRWRKREHWWDGVYGLSLHSVSEKVDVGINNLRLGASFYSKVIATLAVTVTVKITVTSNHIA